MVKTALAAGGRIEAGMLGVTRAPRPVTGTGRPVTGPRSPGQGHRLSAATKYNPWVREVFSRSDAQGSRDSQCLVLFSSWVQRLAQLTQGRNYFASLGADWTQSSAGSWPFRPRFKPGTTRHDERGCRRVAGCCMIASSPRSHKVRPFLQSLRVVRAATWLLGEQCGVKPRPKVRRGRLSQSG